MVLLWTAVNGSNQSSGSSPREITRLPPALDFNAVSPPSDAAMTSNAFWLDGTGTGASSSTSNLSGSSEEMEVRLSMDCVFVFLGERGASKLLNTVLLILRKVFGVAVLRSVSLEQRLSLLFSFSARNWAGLAVIG